MFTTLLLIFRCHLVIRCLSETVIFAQHHGEIIIFLSALFGKYKPTETKHYFKAVVPVYVACCHVHCCYILRGSLAPAHGCSKYYACIHIHRSVCLQINSEKY